MLEPLEDMHPLYNHTVALLEHLYQVGCKAHQNNQSELSALCAYSIFDIIDYARHNMVLPEDTPHFKILSGGGYYSPKPATLSELEKFAAEHFLHNKCFN